MTLTLYSSSLAKMSMGHVNNHLATLVCGGFAVVLTGLWPLMVNFAPILNIVFLMAVPIIWFLTFIVWIAQRAADYNHVHNHDEKKTLWWIKYTGTQYIQRWPKRKSKID